MLINRVLISLFVRCFYLTEAYRVGGARIDTRKAVATVVAKGHLMVGYAYIV